jgi:hypothetical protein
MKTPHPTRDETLVARTLAAEDLRRGDFVSILHEILEYPSFYWSCDAQLWPPDELVRLTCPSSDGGTPLKVKAICLPFVFVKQPNGQHRALDVRRHRLVRLVRDYARPVWKALRQTHKRQAAVGRLFRRGESAEL